MSGGEVGEIVVSLLYGPKNSMENDVFMLVKIGDLAQESDQPSLASDHYKILNFTGKYLRSI